MLRRTQDSLVREALADTPVVLIHGPRQAGKSTLARAIGGDSQARRYITLDDPAPRAQAQGDPGGFLAQYEEPLTIDEVQRAPELFLAIKAAVDRDRRPGKYLLTGSANVLSLPRIADSLAGRMAIVDLPPLSQAEFEQRESTFVQRAFDGALPRSGSMETQDIAERVLRGGFPEPSLRASEARRAAWFEDYIRTLIERDVRDLANIEALGQLPRIIELLSLRAGATLNVVGLSRDTGIPNTTLHRYIDLLVALFLVQTVPAWSSNRGTRLTRSPKAYIVDSGLQCHLMNVSAASFAEDRSKLANPLENFVATELRKLSAAHPARPRLHHLRTVRQLEVDFVLELRGGGLVGIDVKASGTLHPDDAGGLRFLRELAKDDFRSGVVLYTGKEIEPLDGNILAMPISSLWLI